MKKKIIGIIICTLLITSAVIPITGFVLKNNTSKSAHFRGEILVDDDKPPEWYNETQVKTIQEGIDNASTGYTVYVFNGTYEENIVVWRTIDLTGESKDNAIIHGVNESDNAVLITSDWCNVSMFTIENGGSYSGGIKVKADHCSIYDSILYDNDGIGIYVEYCDYTKILDNTFEENSNGIEIFWSDYTTISFNNILNNKNKGIQCRYSKNNDILSNTVDSNPGKGIWLNNECDNNNISNNTLISNGEEGIRLYLSDDNTVSNNIVSNNGDTGEDGGIVCFNSHYNDIFSNLVDSNTDQGIFIENSNYNMVFRNNVYNNNIYGINCESANNNILYNNNLINNSQNGRDDSTNTNTWHNSTLEQGNYWDDYTGEDSEGDGIGDTSYEIPGGDNEDEYPLMTPYGPPNADFTYTVDEKNVIFNASRSYDYDGYITLYEWEFGDDTTGYGSPIEHTYSDDGSYDVTLTVTDNDGENDTGLKTILVDSTPPEIIDNSNDTATTGDIFTFNATVTDNVEVEEVYATYKYGDGNYHSVDMYNTNGDYWEGNLEILHTLDTIYYTLRAEDTSGNGNCSEERTVTIYDNDLPEITDVKAVPPVQVAGKYVNISAVVTDNINLTEVELRLEYPDGTTENFPIIHNKIGDTYNLNKKYIADGIYEYHIWAKDTSDLENVSEVKTFEIIEGSPPENPQINGPSSGNPDVAYTFEFRSFDGDEDDVSFYIDWGDGNFDETDYYPEGTWRTKTHTWAEEGEFEIKIKAKDITGLESEWSNHTISMPRNKHIVHQSSTSTSTSSQKLVARATKKATR